MRSNPHWLKVSLITLLATGVVGFPVLNLFKLSAYGKDFSQDLPAHVFQMVFEQPPPAGVTVISTSGRSYLSKQWIWMRIQVKKETTDPFLNNYIYSYSGPITGPDALQQIRRNHFVADQRYVVQDQKRVGWDDVYRISRPEVYCFGIGPPLSGKEGLLWNGIAVVDRQRNLIFVHAGGD